MYLKIYITKITSGISRMLVYFQLVIIYWWVKIFSLIFLNFKFKSMNRFMYVNNKLKSHSHNTHNTRNTKLINYVKISKFIK